MTIYALPIITESFPLVNAKMMRRAKNDNGETRTGKSPWKFPTECTRSFSGGKTGKLYLAVLWQGDGRGKRVGRRRVL